MISKSFWTNRSLLVNSWIWCAIWDGEAKTENRAGEAAPREESTESDDVRNLSQHLLCQRVCSEANLQPEQLQVLAKYTSADCPLTSYVPSIDSLLSPQPKPITQPSSPGRPEEDFSCSNSQHPGTITAHNLNTWLNTLRENMNTIWYKLFESYFLSVVVFQCNVALGMCPFQCTTGLWSCRHNKQNNHDTAWFHSVLCLPCVLTLSLW